MGRATPVVVILGAMGAALVLAPRAMSPLIVGVGVLAALGLLFRQRGAVVDRQRAAARRAERSRQVLVVSDLLSEARHRFPAADPARRDQASLMEAMATRFEAVVTHGDPIAAPDDDLEALDDLEAGLRRLLTA